MKIQNRITINFTLFAAIILLLFISIVYVIRVKYREELFYSRLNEKAQDFARFLVEIESQTNIPQQRFRFINPNVMYGEKIIAFDASGRILYDNNEKLQRPISSSRLKETLQKGKIKYSEGRYQTVGISYNYQGRDHLVFISAYDRYGISSLNNLFNLLLGGFIISTVAVYLLGWNFARRSMRPIQALVSQIEKIQSNNLEVRVDSGLNRDEIHYLAEKFNELLSRLDRAFRLQRSFISNASHELRNPFAAIIGQIDVALLKSRSPEEYEKTLVSIREDIEKLTKLTNQLLLLAQTNSLAGHKQVEILRVDELLWQAQAEILSSHPAYRIDVRFLSSPEDESLFEVAGNDTLLKTAFINLIDNACKYSGRDQCSIEIGIKSNGLEINFIDRGPGINEEEKDLIFEPFYRSGQNSYLPGYGIGLSLVKNIVSMHGGSINLYRSSSEENVFSVKLPIQQAKSV
jgi:signal transduction histidine kinase